MKMISSISFPRAAHQMAASVALLFIAASHALAGGGVEPLTVRINDAIALPGGIAAVVFRTYASRPIGQGQICVRMALQRDAANVSAVSGPFEALEGYEVFSSLGDTVQVASFDAEAPGQTTMIRFFSLFASINNVDGPLAVLYYRLGDGVVAGDKIDIDFDIANTYAIDGDGNTLSLSPRGGTVKLRAPWEPFQVAADAEEAWPGSFAQLSMQTKESLALSGGQVALRYNQRLSPLRPKPALDPRYGNVDMTLVSSSPGLVVYEFSSPDQSLNILPGNIISFPLLLKSTLQPGARSLVRLDPALTFVRDASGEILPLEFERAVLNVIAPLP